MQTLQLLEKALGVNPSPKHWCDKLKLNRTAINCARNRGRLSPSIAGGLAIELGENPIQWMAVAAMEAEPESTLKKELLRRVTSLYVALGQLVAFFQRPRLSCR